MRYYKQRVQDCDIFSYGDTVPDFAQEITEEEYTFAVEQIMREIAEENAESATDDRIAELEKENAELKNELGEVRKQIRQFTA